MTPPTSEPMITASHRVESFLGSFPSGGNVTFFVMVTFETTSWLHVPLLSLTLNLIRCVPNERVELEKDDEVLRFPSMLEVQIYETIIPSLSVP